MSIHTGRQLDPNSGARDMLRLDDVVVSTVTMGSDENEKNQGFDLNVFPNPFTDKVFVEFDLPQYCNIDVSVFNLLGIKVAGTTSSNVEAGNHIIELEMSNLPQGEYVIQVKTANFFKTKKIVLLK